MAVHENRSLRIVERKREENWKKPPRKIADSECLVCDTCMRACPAEFGAIVNNGLDVVIVPELCSGCPKCVVVCPVDCIYPDPDWEPTSESVWRIVEGK